jgi:hypothetical protein
MSLKVGDNRPFNPNDLTARDVLLVVLIVICVMALLITYAVFAGGEAYVKWAGLALHTAILFVLFIKYSRSFLRMGSFWILTVILLFIHLSVFGVILLHVAQWKLVWFSAMAFEFPVFLFLRDRYSY